MGASHDPTHSSLQRTQALSQGRRAENNLIEIESISPQHRHHVSEGDRIETETDEHPEVKVRESVQIYARPPISHLLGVASLGRICPSYWLVRYVSGQVLFRLTRATLAGHRELMHRWSSS